MMSRIRMLSAQCALSAVLTLSGCMGALAGADVAGGAERVAGDRVVTLGADLSSEDRAEVAGELGIDRDALFTDALPTVLVTNEEEKKALSGLVADELIGTKAVSSALVELLSPGSGIAVTTKRIIWVTPEMYANALVTAGVKDARVIVAAPADVSGTAALTGIIKAFEKAAGVAVSPQEQRVANEELVRTGQLGNEIGDKQKAAKLVAVIKERVTETKADDKSEIRTIVTDTAGDRGISLTEDQINRIVELMSEVRTLNLTTSDIKKQLEGIDSRVKEISDTTRESKGLLTKILDFLKRLVGLVTAALRIR